MLIYNALNGRRFLVVVRCSFQSSFSKWWSTESKDRNYDLIALPFSVESVEKTISDFVALGVDAVYLDQDSSLRKFTGIAKLFQACPSLLNYEAVFFPDDDIEISPNTINKLFDGFMAANAWLGQPALAKSSYISHFITIRNRSFHIRETNFVEAMCPVMSRDCLVRCLPTFEKSISSWGLDYVWANTAKKLGEKVYIFDSLPVRHTRPVGSGAAYMGIGMTPSEEMKYVLSQYQLTISAPVVLGGKLAHSQNTICGSQSFWATLKILWALSTGYNVRTIIHHRSGYRKLLGESFIALSRSWYRESSVRS